MMLFKGHDRWVRLFIFYVHEHDHLGFGMLTVETAVIYLFILRGCLSKKHPLNLAQKK